MSTNIKPVIDHAIDEFTSHINCYFDNAAKITELKAQKDELIKQIKDLEQQQETLIVEQFEPFYLKHHTSPRIPVTYQLDGGLVNFKTKRSKKLVVLDENKLIAELKRRKRKDLIETVEVANKAVIKADDKLAGKLKQVQLIHSLNLRLELA